MSGNFRVVVSNPPGDPSVPLVKNGGGGDSGGMEPRIAMLEKAMERLEADARELRTDMRSTREDISYMKGRLEHLPTTWAMLTAVIGGQAVFAGVVFGAMKLFGH
jgi:hypothetical protein